MVRRQRTSVREDPSHWRREGNISTVLVAVQRDRERVCSVPEVSVRDAGTRPIVARSCSQTTTARVLWLVGAKEGNSADSTHGGR